MEHTKSLALTPRQHFFMDPVFADCWGAMESGRNMADTEALSGGNSFIRIPWHWNNGERIRELFDHSDVNSSEIVTCKWSYKLLMDVRGFTPDELSIGVTGRSVTITGNHGEKHDADGAMSRSFTRKYVFPSDVVVEEIQCNLSRDGVLHISAPRHFENEESKNSFLASLNDAFTAVKSCVIGSPTRHGYAYSPPQPIADQSIMNFPNSVMTLPDFDMTPFWAREPGNYSQFGNKSDKENFKILFDASQYDPKDMVVHATEHHVILEGQHNEKNDQHGTMSRKFMRKYYLPRSVNASDIKCTLNSNGILEINAPKEQQHSIEDKSHSVLIPIQPTEGTKIEEVDDISLTGKTKGDYLDNPTPTQVIGA